MSSSKLTLTSPSLFCARDLRSGCSTPGGISWEQRGRTDFLALLPMLLLVLPRVWLAFWAMRAHCWFMSSFLSTGTFKTFSTVLLYMTSPSLYSCLGLSSSRYRTLQLLNLMRFSWAHFLRLSRSPWLESLLLCQIHHPASCPLQTC